VLKIIINQIKSLIGKHLGITNLCSALRYHFLDRSLHSELGVLAAGPPSSSWKTSWYSLPGRFDSIILCESGRERCFCNANSSTTDLIGVWQGADWLDTVSTAALVQSETHYSREKQCTRSQLRSPVKVVHKECKGPLPWLINICSRHKTEPIEKIACAIIFHSQLFFALD